MKARAIVIIDYTIDGSFKEVAEEQTKLEEGVAAMLKGNKNVVYHAIDVRERRGDNPPDLKNMKFRSF
jgi:hypothetical protein